VADKKIKTPLPVVEISGERIEPWVKAREEPEIGGQEPLFFPDDVSTPGPEGTHGGPDYDSGGSGAVHFDTREPGSSPLPEESPVPPSPPRGTGFRPGKKTLFVIIAVIIIIAIIVGGFFLFPIIANNSGTPSGDGNSITPMPTVVKNPGSTVTPVTTLKPTIKPTYPKGPGNSPANAGF
jgi:hypothetical protein